jgi:hypothetical protein
MTQNRINTKQPLVQYINNSTNSIVLINSDILKDNSVPQQSEGSEVLTATITPTNANNLLIIRANIYGTVTSASYLQIALFQDAIDNALAVSSFYSHAVGWGTKGILSWSMTAGTTSATTFKIRAGKEAGNSYINADAGGNSVYNGTYLSFLEIYEIKA